MKRAFSGVDDVKQHLEDRIDECNARITAARKAIKEKQRGGIRRAASEIEVCTEARRAYQDALKALNEITPDRERARLVRLAEDIVERVRKALEVIYATSKHGNHDIADGADWATVEGESGDALNLLNDARQDRAATGPLRGPAPV